MRKQDRAAPTLHNYQLSEAQHQQLALLRDQLMITASFVIAATQEEEDEPLQIKRSMLGKLFESFGTRMDDVLQALKWNGRELQVREPGDV